MENKKTQKEKIKEMEALYCEYVHEFDRATQREKEARAEEVRATERKDYHEAEYQRGRAEEASKTASCKASASCAVAEVLAIFRGWGVDAVQEDLHTRYNLWHFGE